MIKPVNGFFSNMDKICDKIPVISSLSNLVNLFQKALFIPCAEVKGHYYSYLQKKSAVRCICLLIPVIGNLAIAIHDFSKSNTRIKPVDISTVLSESEIDCEWIALRSMEKSLEHASFNYKNNEILVRHIVSHDGSSLKHASDDLKNHKYTVLAAVAQNGMALQYASDELKNDKEIVLKAVAQNGMAFQFAGEDLKNDLDVAVTAAKQNKDMMEFVPKISWLRNRNEIKAIIEKKECS